MRKTLKGLVVLSLVFGSLGIISCKDQNEEKDEMAPEHQMHSGEDMSDEGEETTARETEGTEFKNDKVKQAFNEYLEVKDALVRTDASASRKAAETLQNTLSEPHPEIAEIAGKLVQTEGINEQREIFSELTAAMDPVLKEAISSGKIYKQFCPMAFEGKGDYWYSTSEEIRNPYFGDKMLKCGRVDETIM